MAKKQFKAESKRLLDMMINSIYTHQEIFLRELISNASDAIDKLCFLSLTDDKVGMDRSDFRIRILTDKDNRTLTVSDNGVGMTAEELEKNLGVIAKSGTLAFKKEQDADAMDKADIDVIGQFGVGFYSAFMVAKKVVVISRAYGAESANRWESQGTDGYTVTPCEKETVGTDVILTLKDDTEEENYGDYLSSWRLKELVKKYSDYVRWPISMEVETTRKVDTGETDENGVPKMSWETVTEEQVVNSMVPLWQRSRKEASDEECAAFYKESFRDGEDPVAVIRVNAEGAVSYRCLLFVPARAPYDFYTREYQPGLRLYSNGVMIMDKCPDLLPECFRFVRGVVDSPDLNLNISREMLQHDRQLKLIAANLEKKIKAELSKLMENDREKYEKFYRAFGIQLKYGVVSDYGMKRDLLTDLLLFWSADKEKLISLKEYAEAMPTEQTRIYYASAETAERAAKLPQTEQVRAHSFDILCFDADVDEFVAQILGAYEEKPFCNVVSQDLGLETDEEKEKAREADEKNRELLDFVLSQAEGRVASVKISRKLKNYAVCLSSEGEITLEMEKYFHSIPGADPNAMKAVRVLELNMDHPAVQKLAVARVQDPERAAVMAKVLLTQAELAAGVAPEDPAAYGELVCSLF
ncbi:MAG: molecular chaperone HtpG [Oscillospiraceae bacterium]|nr:molecular chaperone HtpG [Oscillospiraceae bacterium]